LSRIRVTRPGCATILFASDRSVGRWTVFLGAAGALVLISTIGVGVGSVLSHYLSPRVLSVAAGLGFIAIGIWTLPRPARARVGPVGPRLYNPPPGRAPLFECWSWYG